MPIVPFHATIIAGGQEQRKEKALQIAMTLVCSAPEAQRPCGQCRDCRKAKEGIHPDIIPVERFMAEKDIGGMVKVDPVRALRNDAFISPNEARSKVYIIDNAHTMNDSAQNALLKTLEEGPPYAAFLLLTESAGALLETIRSRCALIHTGEAEAGELDEGARRFARCIAEGDELSQCEFLAQMECSSPDKKAMENFFSSLARLLDDAVVGSVKNQFIAEESRLLAGKKSRAELLRLGEVARKAGGMSQFNVTAGNQLGWLGTQV
jgi:DNA polymerase III subunit delta'